MEISTPSRGQGSRSIVAIVGRPEEAKERKETVLEEDVYVEALSRIIERDYFPDLPKLRNQYEWNEAVLKGDVAKMRDIQALYAKRTREEAIGSTGAPNFAETPLPPSKRARTEELEEGVAPATEAEKIAEKMNLDVFVNSYTSEDNAAFEEIMEESHQKHRARHPWLHEPTTQQLLLESSGSRMALTWPYNPNNSLMNVPGGTKQVTTVVDSAAPPEIVTNNTRIDPETLKNLSNAASSKKTTTRNGEGEFDVIKARVDDYVLLSQRKAMESKRLDLDEIRGLHEPPRETSSGPSVGGFELLSEPSATPYRNETIVTWGSIDGTPLLLDPSATPAPMRPKNEFKVPATPKREQVGMALADEVVYEQRRKKIKVDGTGTTIRTPGSSTPYTPRSAAGQKLAERLARRKAGSDAQLRASYKTPTHLRTPTTPTPAKTPIGFTTPQPPSVAASKEKAKEAKKTSSSLTDDLLNL